MTALITLVERDIARFKELSVSLADIADQARKSYDGKGENPRLLCGYIEVWLRYMCQTIDMVYVPELEERRP